MVNCSAISFRFLWSELHDSLKMEFSVISMKNLEIEKQIRYKKFVFLEQIKIHYIMMNSQLLVTKLETFKSFAAFELFLNQIFFHKANKINTLDYNCKDPS